MNEECPTGILLDFSEPAEIKLSPEFVRLSTTGLSSVEPVYSKHFGDCTSDKNHLDSHASEENANVSSEFDCDFIENETLNDLSACSTQSSSISEDEVLPITWSPKISKKKSRRSVKNDLSIGQRVEVFKEATSIAMHLENLIRGTPPPTPLKCLFTSPLQEINHYNRTSNAKGDLESNFDLEICTNVGIENKRPEPETGNQISFRPPMFAKPEARVQPILKPKIKKDYTSETFSKALRINKNKAMAAATSSSKQSGPMKVKPGSPLKRSMTQQRVIAKGSIAVTNSKTPLLNSKRVSSIGTPLDANFTTERRVATVARSSSFGPESLRARRQSSILSTSFSEVKSAIHSQTPVRMSYQPQTSKTNSKSTARKSISSVYSTPVSRSASESRRLFTEPSACTINGSVIPTSHSTPHQTPSATAKVARTPLRRSSSTSGDVPKRNIRRDSTNCDIPKKIMQPIPKVTTRLQGLDLK